MLEYLFNKVAGVQAFRLISYMQKLLKHILVKQRHHQTLTNYLPIRIKTINSNILEQKSHTSFGIHYKAFNKVNKVAVNKATTLRKAQCTNLFNTIHKNVDATHISKLI